LLFSSWIHILHLFCLFVCKFSKIYSIIRSLWAAISISLSLVRPLRICCIDTWIRDGSCVVGFEDALLINCLEMVLIMGGPVSNNNLARILIWHDHTRHWQPASVRSWVIWRKFFLHHARVLRWSRLKCSPTHGHYLGGLIQVLEACWMFPAGLLQRIRNCNRLPLTPNLLLNMRASHNLVVAEVDCGFIKLNRSKKLRIVDISGLAELAVVGGLGSFVFWADGGGLWSLSLSLHLWSKFKIWICIL